MTPPRARVIARWAACAILFGCGLTLSIGGSLLVSLRGSPYYLISGLALLACALWFNSRRTAARRLYITLLGMTFAWAFWEAGMDLWALAPRILTPLALGVVFLTPRARSVGGVARVAGFLLVAIAVGAILHFSGHLHPPDPVFRTGFDRRRTLAAGQLAPSEESSGNWLHVGNDSGATRFSDLTEVTRANVARLQLAWTYRTGEARAALEVTPLKVGDSLYLCTGNNDVIALDAETGRQRWRFNSGADRSPAIQRACRGVAYFQVAGSRGACAARIFTNTIDARLIALDAVTGLRCEGFGLHGEISLLNGMGDWHGRVIAGYYSVTSAPTVVRGRIVVGGWISDAQYWGEPSGVIRAFDAVTGRFVWAFDMGRPDRKSEPPEGQHYTASTPNAWAPMSSDEELGLVYAPTGNTSGSDYYGVRRRSFDEQYSSAVVALDALDGTVRWVFQTVHHDLWDYDVAPQPVLTDIATPLGNTHALLQATKTGEIFVLDRVDGSPIFPVDELPVASATSIPGERISPTQPASLHLPSFSGARLEERDMWGLTPIDQMLCRIRFRQARYEGIFTPPGIAPSIEYPGILGGVEWSSVSVDPLRGLMFVNASRIANYARLVPRAQADAEGRRPEGFGGHYMQRAEAGTPYAVSNPPFLSPLGVPCQNPPFGTISAVNLETGRLLWTRWLGTARESGPAGLASHLPLPLGTPNLGGSLATRAGLVFIASGQDRRIRAFGSEDGKLLWEQPLPAASVATPMTYRSERSRRQFIAVAAGNADPRFGASGDFIVAYAIPR